MAEGGCSRRLDGEAGPGSRPVSPVLLRRLLAAAGMMVVLWPVAQPLPAAAEGRMTVVDATNVRRTCPSAECGGVGRFNVGESVVDYETEHGWTRVTPYYTAACNDGLSAFVQSGPADCTRQNGIAQGEFAEWVRTKFLKIEAPSGAVATGEPCDLDACVMPGSVRSDGAGG